MFPLVNGLEAHAPEWEILPAPPSQLLQLLNEGACDLAMIPAYDYLTNRDRFGVLPGSCIATRNEAESVLVLSSVPLADAAWLELDRNSHTSNALVRILLRGPLNCPDIPISEENVRVEAAPPGAYLRIGDRAMRERAFFRHCIDLGQVWTSWQKMPFVFAVWATQGNLPWDEIGRYLGALRDDNLRSIRSRLAERPSVLPEGVSLDAATRYFRHSLCYTLGKREWQGLEKYAELLAELDRHVAAR